MIFKELEIDFIEVKDLKEMHELLKHKFGFPDFYGKNIHALIDCLSSIRFPEDGMSSFVLDNVNEVLLLKVKNLTSTPPSVMQNFLFAIETVNERCTERGEDPSILVLFNW